MVIAAGIGPGCRYAAEQEASDRDGIFAAAPQIEVLAVTLEDETPEAARIVVTLNVTNPNDFTLPVHHVAYRLSVEGYPAFELPDDQPQVALSPSGSVVVRLPAIITTGDENALMSASGRPFELRGHLTTQRPGRLIQASHETGLPKPRVRFAANGVIQ